MSGLSVAATDLWKSHGTGAGRVRALDGIGFVAQPGEMTLVVGPSGCGKSTLLAILGGLTPPDAGTVTVGETEIWALPPRRLTAFRLETCGFVFQGFNLFPAASALQQVMLPLGPLGLSRDEAMTRARHSLERVGLGHRLDRRPDQLSGGEKQRVAIARALAKRPPLVFADEPTSALDKENGAIVGALLRTAAHEDGVTVLCVSHDQRLIDVADRVVAMEDGRVVGDSRPNRGTDR
jgi:putative ABC transport system ATP-binding protein